MRFVVDTANKTIVPQITGAKMKLAIPEEHFDYWKGIEDKIVSCNVDLSRGVNYVHYEKGKIWFGSRSTEPTEELDGFGKTVHRSIFHPAFGFDLASRALVSLNGMQISTDVIRGINIPSSFSTFASYKHNATPEDVQEAKWLSEFMTLWRNLAKYDSNKSRTSMRYLFSMDKEAKLALAVGEKIIRAGWRISSHECIGIVRNAKDKQDELLKCKPYVLCGIPESMFKELAAEENLSYYATYSKCQYLKVVSGWSEISPVLKKLGKTGVFLSMICETYGAAHRSLLRLMNTYSYDRSRLMEYLFKDLPEIQGFKNSSEAVRVLDDYSSLAFAVWGEVKNRYPKYLKSEHDMMVLKHSEVQEALRIAKYAEHYDPYRKRFDWTSKTVLNDNDLPYMIVCPTSPEDVVEEGKEMHHCVATYVGRVDESLILFLRSREDRYYNRSQFRHLTIEYSVSADAIVQAKKQFNAEPDEKDMLALKEFCVYAGLKMSEVLMEHYEKVTGLKYEDAKEREAIAC